MPRQNLPSFASFAPFAPRVAVFVCVAGVIACSGTTTGNGTGSGGTGGGLFGGGTSGGTATGGGTPTVVPTSCSAAASDDACTACLKSSCCSPTLACSNDPECNAVFTCALNCTSQTCTDDCIAAHPTAQARLRVFVTCEEQFCATACGGTSSSTSGGTTSGGSSGGADTCLADTPQDPSYCPNMPARQTVKDCPNGPPSTLCVASPIGAANVYCCP